MSLYIRLEVLLFVFPQLEIVDQILILHMKVEMHIQDQNLSI